jgi:hypothetical protein
MRKPEIAIHDKPSGMKHLTILITAFIMLLCVLCTGCTTQPDTAPVATPTPVTIATTVPATAAATAVATTAAVNEPVQSLPSAQDVSVELSKDRPTSKITLLYQGGAGDVFTSRIMMRVYSNTTAAGYIEYVMSDGKKPIPGDEIVAPGTRGSDRVAVFITSGGTVYKVKDEKLVYEYY